VDESSTTNGGNASESDVIQTEATVVTKRKRGRPRKAEQIDNTPFTANGQEEVISETLSLTQAVINTADNPEGTKLDNVSSDNTITPRRASTRVRTPRINLNLYDHEAEENKRKHKRVKGNTPKKRGRKPKIVSDENVMDDSVRDSDCEKTHEKKPRKKPSSVTAGNECNIGGGTKENVDGNSVNVDDEKGKVHDDNEEGVDKEEDDEDEDDNVKDDGNGRIRIWCIHFIFPPV